MNALDSATDLSQAIRCGQEFLRQAVERLAVGQKVRKGGVLEGHSTWANALEECGRGFVEQCAALVEACSGAPPALAQRLFSCAVRLAEALGTTEPLLAALDKELSLVGERVVQLELLYTIALQRVEAISSEVPGIEKRVAEAGKQAAEAAKAKDQMNVEMQKIRKALQNAERRRAAAEARATELGRELHAAKREAAAALKKASEAESRATSAESNAADARRAASATPRDRLRKSMANLRAGNMMGSQSALSSTALGSSTFESPPSTCATEANGEFSTARVGLSEPGSSTYRRPRGIVPLGSASREPPLRSHSGGPVDSSICFSPDGGSDEEDIFQKQRTDVAEAVVMRLEIPADRRAVSQRPSGRISSDDDASSVRTHTLAAAKSSACSDSSDAAEATCSRPLARGSIWACTLSKTNPLSASAQAAFMHLTALVREARERHPSLGSPRGECRELNTTAPSEGLQHVAGHVRRWAETELAVVDRGLAGSIAQSASHLQTLAGLAR